MNQQRITTHRHHPIASRPWSSSHACILRPCGVQKQQAGPGAHGSATAPSDGASSTSAGGSTPSSFRVTPATIDDIKAFHKSQLCEYDYLVQDAWVEGTIPKELVGTYLRNGPGMQTAGRHTFDGDGQVIAFCFDGSGRVRFRNRFVRTRGFLDEQAAGKPLHRTAFTKGAADSSQLLWNPFDMQLKNVANTGVLHWAGRLLALYESNLPHELDPTSLNTFGETSLDGQLQTPVLAAHYRVMSGLDGQQQQQQGRQPLAAAAPAYGSSGSSSANGSNDSNGSSRSSGSSSNGDPGNTVQAGDTSGKGQQQQQQPQPQQLHSAGSADGGRTLVSFSFNAGFGTGAEVIFYEFAEHDGRLRHAPCRHQLPGVTIALIHDIAVTKDYYILALGPIDFSLPKFATQYLTSRCSIAECMEFRPQDKPTQLHVIPRPSGAAAGTLAYVIDMPTMFNFHHVNAFQLPAPTTTTTQSSSSSQVAGNGHSSSSSGGTSPSSAAAQAGAAGSGAGRQLLVLDTVGWDSVSFEDNQHNLTTEYYKGGARPTLQRLVFELDPPLPADSSNGSSRRNGSSSSSSSSTGRCLSCHPLMSRTCEFPSVSWDMHGRPHTHIYCCADVVDDPLHWGPTQAVLKLSRSSGGSTSGEPASGQQPLDSICRPAMRTQLWAAGSRRYVCEPLFVPKPRPAEGSPGAEEEDEGWVLAVVHNAATDRGELVILDAQHIEAGPLATIRLPHHLPAGLHGSFSPQVLLQDWEAVAGDADAWRTPQVVRAV